MRYATEQRSDQRVNAVAESVTGWTQAEAAGQPLDALFRII